MDLELRKSYLGGTDIAVICGLSPYKTPYELWEEKTSKEKPVDFDNDFMALGRELEDGAARLFAMRNPGMALIEPPPQPLRHPEHPFLAANYDRLAHFPNEPTLPKKALEVKTTVRTVYKSWNGMVPDTYWCQIQHYLGILNPLMGIRTGTFVVLVLDERKIYDIEVELDEAYVDQLWNYAVWWWNHHVIEGNEPDLTAKEFDAATPLPASSVLADEQATTDYHELRNIKSQIKDLQYKQEVVESRLKTYIQTSERLINLENAVMATYTKQTRKAIDSKQLQKDHPELFESYAKKSSFRVLRLRDET